MYMYVDVYTAVSSLPDLHYPLLALLQSKELLLVGGEDEEAGRGVVREVGHVGVEEPRVVELGEADRGPALGRAEAGGRVD